VRILFNAVYAASEGILMQWTGEAASCIAGGTAAVYRDAVARRINYFRAMAGVPAAITFNDVFSTKDQEAALMMSVNDALSHYPTNTWLCYTAAGSEAAGKSNLAIGQDGPHAVDGYMQDFGQGNEPVGHRRWLLYPQTLTMGTGDVAGEGNRRSANATWVVDSNYGGPRPATRTPFVSWPPAGFVPYQVVYPRWSFSLPNADFTNANVTLSSNSVNAPVVLEPLATRIGENTLVWHLAGQNPDVPSVWPRPSADTVYTVSITNVLLGEAKTNFSYQVTIIDSTVPGPDTVLPSISGPAEPYVGAANRYTFVTLPEATGYQWQSSRRSPLTAVEDAENGLTWMTADTSAGYSVIASSPPPAGNDAFHLAHPTNTALQTLTSKRRLLPGANAQVVFKSRLAYATTGQVARVQVRAGGAGVWGDIYSQAGKGNTPPETTFIQRTASLAAYAGRSLEIRFAYEYVTGFYYPQTDSDVGWFIDDISFNGVEELTGASLADVTETAAFVLTPTAPEDLALEVRAQVYGEYNLEWGPALSVKAVVGTVPPVLQFVGTPVIASGQITLDFDVANYRPGLVFQLWKSPGLPVTWGVETAATFRTITPNSRFQATAPAPVADRGVYYRVGTN
jgi:hypothetical protein